MTMLRIDDIRTDGGTQSRVQTNWLAVGDYAADIAEGATFPPVTVFYDGSDYWLADGFHRIEAHKRLGLVEISADVKQGTRRDAILYSVKANAIHGLRRTNDDKRRAVMLLLEDEEWRRWSDREIARRCGVDDKTVSSVRKSICGNSADTKRQTRRNGVVYEIETAGIGRPVADAPVADDAPAIDLFSAPPVIEDEEMPEPEPMPIAAPPLQPAILSPVFRIHHGDMRDVIPTLEPGSIDAIITDPPYPREYVSLYGDLARLAAYVLKPGGSLLVMAGQSYLPDVLALMTPHLRYHWQLAYLTLGGQSPQIWPRKVNTFWKPVFWFVNGDYDGNWHGDVIKSAVNDNDKRFHDWGQSESGIGDIVEKFTTPGAVVLDPFCGGGTTGKVALDLGRQFVGIDIDAASVATAMRRLGEGIYAASQA